jgi:hypothetical protein
MILTHCCTFAFATHCIHIICTIRLSKVIAQRWKDLPEYGRKFYRTVARTDLEHYQRDLLQLQPYTTSSIMVPTSTNNGNDDDNYGDDDPSEPSSSRFTPTSPSEEQSATSTTNV